jgi:hypothetical protein
MQFIATPHSEYYYLSQHLETKLYQDGEPTVQEKLYAKERAN